MKYLKNANGIKVGDKFRYRSSGYGVDGMVSCKGTMFDAEVIQVTKHLIALRILCDQTTVNSITFGEAMPYNWSIRKVDIGRTERLYLPEEVIDVV